MQKNEIQILGVPNKPPTTLKSNLKKEEKKKKPNIQEALCDLFFIFFLYQVIHLETQRVKMQPNDIDQMLRIDLFSFWILQLHLKLIAIYTNLST